MPAYKMTAYPRGLALIIEIEEFVNNVEKPRIGSHVSYCFKTIYVVSIIVPLLQQFIGIGLIHLPHPPASYIIDVGRYLL